MERLTAIERWATTENKQEFINLTMQMFPTVSEEKALKMWEDAQKELRSNQYDDHKSDYLSTNTQRMG